MLRTYFSFSTHLIFIIFIGTFYFFGFGLLSISAILIYGISFSLFRKTFSKFREDPTVKEGVLYSPVNGKVLNVRSGVDHIVFGRELVELRLMIPWWKEMGIFLPISSEVRDLVVKKGKSFFRMSREDLPTQSQKMADSLSLILTGAKGERVGMQMLKCPTGFWPEIGVMPGDRGKRQVNIGYFPLGGTVLLYLPQNYEILVNTDDVIEAGQTLIAGVPDL